MARSEKPPRGVVPGSARAAAQGLQGNSTKGDGVGGSRAIWLGLALLLLAFVPFLPALGAGTTWDEDFLTDSPVLESPDGLVAIWTEPSVIPHEEHYWPLFYTTFWIEAQLFGRSMFVFHLTNLLLHALASWLLWRVLKHLGLRAAWLAAALFAVHPLHVESVAWTIERKDVLSGCFYLLAALLFLRRESSGPGGTRWGSASWGALVALAAGLLCKSIVVTLPFALAVGLYYARGRVAPRTWRALLPLTLLAVAGGAFDAIYSSGNATFESAYTLTERIATAGQSIWFYVAKTFLPLGQMPFYPRFDPSTAWLALGAVLATLALLFALRKRIGRGPLAAALFFGLTVAPTLGLIEFSYYAHFSFVADRFVYLASIGPLCLAAGLIERLRTRLPERAGLALVAVPLVLLAGATWRLTTKYHDLKTFSTFALETNPQSWAANALRAWQHAADGEPYEAEDLYAESVRLRPGFVDTLLGLGNAVLAQGRLAEAEAHFRAATEAAPDSWRAHHALGRTLYQAKRLNEAVAPLERAVALAPNSAPACSTLGQLLAARGSFEAAQQLLERAVALEPSDEGARRALDLVRELSRSQPGRSQLGR